MTSEPPPRWPASEAAGVDAAARAMRDGGLLLVPTESSYALGADPRCATALERLRHLKRRDAAQPLLLLCSDLEQAAALADFDERASRLAGAWPAPLTLVLSPRPGSIDLAGALGGEGLALRVPAHAAARALAASLGHPFTGTSANRSGAPPLLDPSESAVLGAPVAVLDAGRLRGGPPSTVVDLTGPLMRVVREGAVSTSAVERLLAGVSLGHHPALGSLMPSPPLLGVTGPNSSGKGVTADYLRDAYGYASHSLSDVVRDEARRRGLEPVRDVLIPIGNEMRREGGAGALAARILPRLIPPALVDSIRNPEEVAVLRRLPGFLLLALEAPMEVRLARSLLRARPGDPVTLEAFREREERENSADPASQQLRATARMADHLILNDGSIEDLHARIDALMAHLSR